MEERFYVSKTSGYPSSGGASFEREWAVLDRMECHKIVACFYAYRVRGMNVEQWDSIDAAARRRAKLYALALNRAEAGEHFNWSDLRIDPRMPEWGPELTEILVSR